MLALQLRLCGLLLSRELQIGQSSREYCSNAADALADGFSKSILNVSSGLRVSNTARELCDVAFRQSPPNPPDQSKKRCCEDDNDDSEDDHWPPHFVEL